MEAAVWEIAKNLDERNNVEVHKLEEMKLHYELELRKVEALEVRNKVELFKALLLHERSQSISGGDVGEITSSIEDIREQVDETIKQWMQRDNA